MDHYAVVVFPDEAKAAAGARVLRELDEQGALDLYDLALVQHDPQGRTAVAAQGVPGAAVGALAGGLLGLLGGPVGAAVGAVSGAWIGTWRDLSELGAQAEFAERVRQELKPGRAAVVAELEERDPSRVDRRMEQLDGVIVRGSQSDPVEADFAQQAAAIIVDLETASEGSSDAAEARTRAESLRTLVRDELERLQQQTEQRAARLEADSAAVNAQERELIDRRLAAARERAARREASLRRTLELLETVP